MASGPDIGREQRSPSPQPAPRLALQRRASAYEVELVRRVCRMAGDASLRDNVHATIDLQAALVRHDTPTLFGWLMSALSYQGISDQVARGYMDRHGQVT